MSKKRYRPEEIIGTLREADILLSQGKNVVDVIKALAITDVTYCARSRAGVFGDRKHSPGSTYSAAPWIVSKNLI